MMDKDISDALSIALQEAAKRDSKMLFPIALNLSEDNDKIANMLLRRKYVERYEVNDRSQYWKYIRGTGYINLKITDEGLQAINW